MFELALLLGLFALVGSSSSSSSSGGTTPGGGDVSGSRKQELWVLLRSIPELDETQREFFMLVAAIESNYNPKAHNDSASESAASADAFDGQLAARLRSWGYPDAAWTDGSGGRFGRLHPYFGDDWFDLYGEPIAPSKLFESPYDLISAMKAARTLQNYPAFKAKPTVGTLRLGFWGPGKMKTPQDAEHLAKYRKVVVDEKLSPGLVDRVIKPLPSFATIAAIGKRLLADPTPGVPAVKPPEGPISTTVVPQPWAARKVTDDKGFFTVAWWLAERTAGQDRVWIRVDARLDPPNEGTFRWVVFDHNANVRKYEPNVVGTAQSAAELAAKWIAENG